MYGGASHTWEEKTGLWKKTSHPCKHDTFKMNMFKNEDVQNMSTIGRKQCLPQVVDDNLRKSELGARRFLEPLYNEEHSNSIVNGFPASSFISSTIHHR